MTSTSDLLDEHGERAGVCLIQFRQYGGRSAFSGPISSVRCFEDNVVLKRQISTRGNGRVLVVDAGGSLRCALVGDMIAGIGVEQGWAGIVLHGCVRDVAALRELPIGLKALGSIPRPSSKRGEGEVDVPVRFGDVTFTPGAMLHSDEDGIVVLDA
jgi:regulator of ribonuclease activity A